MPSFADVELQPSQVNEYFARALRAIGPMIVVGEVQQVSAKPGQHIYFELADADGCVNCAIWKSTPQGLGDVVEGDLVRAYVQSPWFGKNNGQIKLSVSRVERLGAGDLIKRFELLKAKLEAEGLIGHPPRPWPYLPRVIGLISARGGDGYLDALTSIYERFPARVLFCPSCVQGLAALPQLTAAISRLESQSEVDLIVIARGGGSKEDLALFNEEALARAIFACKKPVVTALGHTPDIHIADLVADRYFPVPNAVGIGILPSFVELVTDLDNQRQALGSETLLATLTDHLDRYGEELFYSRQQAAAVLGRRRGELDERRHSLLDGRRRQRQAARDLDHLGATLKGLDAFERGFVAVFDDEGRPLASAQGLQPGQSIQLRLKDGSAQALLEEVTLDPTTDTEQT